MDLDEVFVIWRSWLGLAQHLYFSQISDILKTICVLAHSFCLQESSWLSNGLQTYGIIRDIVWWITVIDVHVSPYLGDLDRSFVLLNISSTFLHCRQRAPVGIVLSSSGTSQLGMFDIQATTKCKYYDHIVLLYLESRRCRYRSFIFACFTYMFLWLT